MSYVSPNRLSIVIPAYNRAQTVVRCLLSLQLPVSLRTEMEILVINDGSTDDTAQVVEQCQARYPELNIQLHNYPNRGVSVARNRGIELSQGKYIWFVDSDDWVNASTLCYFVEEICQEDYDVVCFGMNPVLGDRPDHFEEPIPNPCDSLVDRRREMTGAELLLSRLQNGNIWQQLWRRDFLLEHQAEFPDQKIFEDIYFHCRMISHANRVLVLPCIGYYYYLHSRSIMHDANDHMKRASSYLEGACTLLDYLVEEINTYPSLRNYYYERACNFYKTGIVRMLTHFGTKELKPYTAAMDKSEHFAPIYSVATHREKLLITTAHKMPTIALILVRLWQRIRTTNRYLKGSIQ